MATFNQIQRPDLLQRLTKRLGLNERAPVSTLQPELQAVVLLEDLSTQSPFVQPTGRLASATGLATAVVGQFSQFELENPAGSGIVAVVRRIMFDVNPAGTLDYGFRDPGGGNLVSSTTRAWWDQRLGGLPTCVPRYGANAVNFVNPRLGWFAKQSGLETSIIPGLEIVVDQGRVFRASLRMTGVQLDFTVEWQEFTE